jgi:hypothetical protein
MIIVNGFSGGLALPQTDHPAASDVDGGEEEHGI